MNIRFSNLSIMVKESRAFSSRLNLATSIKINTNFMKKSQHIFVIVN